MFKNRRGKQKKIYYEKKVIAKLFRIPMNFGDGQTGEKKRNKSADGHIILFR
jgi:hypothetical protein